MSPVAAGAAVTQYARPTNLMRYTPPDTNFIPATDNGTHPVSTAAAVTQLRTMMHTGSAVQGCMGVCDPDRPS